jgi:hypothetical protein
LIDEFISAVSLGSAGAKWAGQSRINRKSKAICDREGEGLDSVAGRSGMVLFILGYRQGIWEFELAGNEKKHPPEQGF